MKEFIGHGGPNAITIHLGVCKNPELFQMVFPDVIFFFLLSHLDQRIHMSEEREKE